MQERDPSQIQSDMNTAPNMTGRIVSFPNTDHSAPSLVTFDRMELRAIFNLYGRMVAAGEWKDYALDFSIQKAVFSIYRRASDYALYRIEKDPKLTRKQGAYCVLGSNGQILKRGSELPRVLQVLEKKLTLVSS
mgnify:CR=1 FL=1